VETNKALVEEQLICVSCGFCCDGTLFVHAVLKPGERGHLPEKIEENAFREGEKDYFRLPCKYFYGKCSIYDKERADVCGAYRCQLLRDMAETKISPDEVLKVVKEARAMRSDLLEQYRRFSGNSGETHFVQILKELGKHNKQLTGREATGTDYEIFQARCNIFETLLIRHFRSAEEFDKMIMK
jgi:hypothetical protein